MPTGAETPVVSDKTDVASCIEELIRVRAALDKSLVKLLGSDAAKDTREEIESEKLLQDIDAVLAKTKRNIDAWLASLAGRTFENLDEAQELIFKVRYIVSRAGLELMHKEWKVTMTCNEHPSQNNITFQLREKNTRPQKNRYGSILFPLLHTSIIALQTEKQAGKKKKVNTDEK